jgi:hypothetical protein
LEKRTAGASLTGEAIRDGRDRIQSEMKDRAWRRGEKERVRVCGDDWTVRGDVMAAWVGSSADGGGLGFGQTMLVRRIGNIWTVKMLSRGDPWKGIPKL